MPFGAYFNGTTYRTSAGLRYQQIYSGSEFTTGPFVISDIGFASFFLQQIRPMINVGYDVEISFAYTDRQPANPGSTIDVPLTLAFDDLVVAPLTQTPGDFDLKFHLATPFRYDPTLGNLLFDVRVNAVTVDSTIGDSSFSFLAGTSPSTARVGYEPNFSYGLVTAFSDDGNFPLYSVPEPGAGALLGVGVGLGGFVHWRRRRA